ncbi:3-dehydroshikimate dehydratase like protein [Verticillium longisporum]|uniref:3-dehydroshikimate dehydratase like protein n=1 Tax=Verticillium longisporum TaxID=100787 RepID=A0A8I2Z5Z9_VERLO|nr:3-dehydroshikimate dehydratase like protein [Verticillium longisporum]KAG7118668.1 3-dehydroshikimate dehydratase like protein [Verticillium longisporum]
MSAQFDLPTSFATCSIGLPHHTLEQKLAAISSAGFTGIELAFPDLQTFATRHAHRDIAADDYPALCKAATAVRSLCHASNLAIIVLQPFSNFEGWREGSPQREEAFSRARGWIDIMDALGTDMLQVGSSDSPDISASVSEVAADIAALADLLAERGFRLAYENWCWATRAPLWRDAWEVVRAADRPNVGLCLDTFQSAGGEWGDPTTASGLIEDRGAGPDELRERYRASWAELAKTVPPEKVFFLQISDAYLMDPPLKDSVDESGTRPRGRWSHDYRPLPYDGGYLPIVEFLAAVLMTGFRGWLSVEVFDGRFEAKYGDDLGGYANKAKEAVDRMLDEMDPEKVTGEIV